MTGSMFPLDTEHMRFRPSLLGMCLEGTQLEALSHHSRMKIRQGSSGTESWHCLQHMFLESKGSPRPFQNAWRNGLSALVSAAMIEKDKLSQVDKARFQIEIPSLPSSRCLLHTAVAWKGLQRR